MNREHTIFFLLGPRNRWPYLGLVRTYKRKPGADKIPKGHRLVEVCLQFDDSLFDPPKAICNIPTPPPVSTTAKL